MRSVDTGAVEYRDQSLISAANSNDNIIPFSPRHNREIRSGQISSVRSSHVTQNLAWANWL